MKPVIIIALAFVLLLLPLPVFAQEEFGGLAGDGLDDVTGNSTNLYNSNIALEQKEPNYLTILLVIGTFTAVAVAFLGNRKAGTQLEKQNEISKKQINFSAMLEIMKIFNDDVNAKRRHTLYGHYRKNSLYNESGEFQNKDLASFAASVRGTYDQMGLLVKDGYVLKEQFLNMYGGSVIRMYKVLQRHIEKERDEINSKQLAINFEWIFNEARNHWKENFRGQPEPEPF